MKTERTQHSQNSTSSDGSQLSAPQSFPMERKTPSKSRSKSSNGKSDSCLRIGKSKHYEGVSIATRTTYLILRDIGIKAADKEFQRQFSQFKGDLAQVLRMMEQMDVDVERVQRIAKFVRPFLGVNI